MKTREWQKMLGEQARLGKTLFTVTELANASGKPRRIVNVELTRLVKYGVAVRHARGLYSLADSAVPLERLVRSLDPHAYVTGAYALMQYGLITQVPTVITTFTTRRHSRKNVTTPSGRIEFTCIKPPIYRSEIIGIAGRELAFCDFVYISLRKGVDPRSQVTFRHLETLKKTLLMRVAKRYPSTVRQKVAMLSQTVKPPAHRAFRVAP